MIINLGGGIHGHPDGVKSGAVAARKALEAASSGVSLEMKAKECKELEIALKRWDLNGKGPTHSSTYTHSLVLSKGTDIMKRNN